MGRLSTTECTYLPTFAGTSALAGTAFHSEAANMATGDDAYWVT